MKVYLDYAATSPVKKEVLKEMLPYLTIEFGNPSSIHEWGRSARTAVDESREKVAKFLNAESSEIIFTSGGTEADNMAIAGVVGQETRNKKPLDTARGGQETKEIPHIITSQIEHHAVLRTCENLEKQGLAEVTYIKPDADGLIDVHDIESAIKENTLLVSIMYVNNEIGTVEPIREIGKMIEKKNDQRKIDGLKRIFFHTDAVQATNYQKMDVDYLHVDLLSISGHKIGAPKGIGALYIRKGTKISPIIFGGEQELNKRAGTENVAGIVALEKAIELVEKTDSIAVAKNRDYLIDRVLKEIPETSLNGSRENRNPNNASFYFKYIEGESILMNLDLVGIAASSGSACTSLSLQPSHVIMALCGEAEQAHGSIRFTLGGDTTKEQIDYVLDNLKIIIKKLRAISPLSPREYKNS